MKVLLAFVVGLALGAGMSLGAIAIGILAGVTVYGINEWRLSEDRKRKTHWQQLHL